MDLNLKGKLALVTGGSRGIGYAVAESLAREGCNVTIVAQDPENLECAAQLLRTSFPSTVITTKAGDLRDSKVVAGLAVEFSEAEILVNNAGAIPHGSLIELSDESWRDGWELKVFGQIGLTRAYYPLMKDRGHGVVINIIGFAGERFSPTYIAGSTGNAALIAFTKTVGSVSAADGIRVVGVSPGPILTERLRSRLKKRAAAELGDPERWPEITAGYPFGRPGEPLEVADTVAFLASERAGYITGSIVNVDGGMANRPVSV